MVVTINTEPTMLAIGDTARVALPWSEVCMHMRVADKIMTVQITGGPYPMAQILRADGSPFCGAITLGEAGIGRTDAGEYFAYEATDSTSQA